MTVISTTANVATGAVKAVRNRIERSQDEEGNFAKCKEEGRC